MPSVLFLPGLFYDHRIWADLPAGPGAGGDAVCFDLHEPMPWREPGTGAFLGAVRRLVSDPGRGVVAATETDAARRAELVTRTWRDVYAGRLAAPAGAGLPGDRRAR